MYKYPEIRTIDDILPHIAGRNEFIVSHRDSFTVIDYTYILPDSFDIDPADPLTGLMRRECRGIIFDVKGNLVSRPFAKFFNMNEREETMAENLDFSSPHTVWTKMDGSMIRPMILNGEMVFGSMRGPTDWGKAAQVWAETNWSTETFSVVWAALERGETPLFEWVSPSNQIVIKYDKEEEGLYYLSSRDNLTGEYSIDNSISDSCPMPDKKPIVQDPEQYIEDVRNVIGEEGIIVYFDNGMLVKLKADEYVKIHRTIDCTRDEWHIAELILLEEIDDIKPTLVGETHDRVVEFENRFWSLIQRKVDYIIYQSALMKRLYSERKLLVMDIHRHVPDTVDASFVMKAIDGYDTYEQVIHKARWKHLSSGNKFATLMEWLENTPTVSKPMIGNE